MEFKEYLIEHLKKHPSMMPRDVAKLCYQAAMGAEHLLLDPIRAKKYFDAEFESVEPKSGELFECLSDDVCRVDLGVWKLEGMPSEWLFNMFLETATVKHGGRELLEANLSFVEDVIGEQETCFSKEEWREFLKEYREIGMPAIHHSEKYRQSERPAYRIVDRSFLRCIPILRAASKLNAAEAGRARVIAIDGRAGSGKTTVSERLSRVLKAETVRIDDFFLPPKLRTPERLAEVGGNVHYERILSEIIPFVDKRKAFSYGAFDCEKMEISHKIEIGESEWRIVEGSYSHHPKLGDYAEIKVFCRVDTDEQMKRITERDGEKWAEIFRERWIPMEEKYFLECKIREKSDVFV